MSTLTILAILIGLGIFAYFIGRMRSIQVCGGEQRTLHSRPTYHGYYLASLTVLPAIILLAAWGVAERPATRYIAMQELGPQVLKGTDAEKALAMSVVDSIADGLPELTPEEDEVLRKARLGFVTTSDARDVLGRHGVVLGSDPGRNVIAAADELASARATSRIMLPIACFAIAALGFAWGYSRIRPGLRARNITESVMRSGLFLASTVAVLTTVGIVLSVLFETIHFFQFVSPFDYFFGTVWDPRFATVGKAEGQFGLLPLLWGTLFISAVALLVAVPVGLFAAIYMSEYAGSKVRAFAKPLLEILAGIPTIVYGFFALTVFGPLLRDLGFNIGLDISASSVLTAGIVMGVMIIPFVSSLSDDIINAVPQSLREGSYGLGATQSETIKKVILPAALPGIVGAVLLAASRAIGETMIVVLAAGIAANLTLNPLEPVTTITVKIVSQLTGDLEFNSPQTLVAFALGLTLFVITLALNVYALYIVRKYREQYE
ncbi:phosphate ABC transporter permease subunit PstC [Methyloceanibacter caenitepidi]|uniref:Phosphate transport system permease protein n=1 Tax=Methyloceanibacter caenitepidi TaxID=1384459 RepID=A0A0A8K1C6_9HYPH|nr:phosphate ABC transporter permease subunit PstC [Methyloceanibacter caenitepidi]BAQ16292.1 phosphate transport system permease protein PstC [Methyloceanibacter caenitepidi]